MSSTRVLRNLAAVMVIVVACPAALFGGALIGCATQGVTVGCALNGIFISPFLLIAAGFVSALLAGGRTGITLMAVGLVAGMIAVAVVAGVGGNPVPIDPIQGVIATIWFGFPVALGYGLGRGVVRLFATRS